MSQDRPWTAKRCTRLLRPLATSITSLRESKSSANLRDLHLASDKSGNLELVRPSRDRAGSSKRGIQSGEELDWLESQPRKRVKRIYRSWQNRSSLSSGSEKYANNSTDLAKAAPSLSIKWLTEKYASIFNSQMATDGTETLRYKPPNKSRGDSNYNGKLGSATSLKRSFEGIMHETRENRIYDNKPLPFPVTTSTGAKSLFDLCLKNVSEHIKDEQAWRKEQNPDDKSDALSDVYDFLESVGSGSAKGWKHLRDVVRAHSVSLACNAIQERLLSDDDVKSLLTTCAKHEALEEAHKLFRTWALTPVEYHNGSRSLEDFLGVHCQFVFFYLGMTAFEYRLFNDMIDCGLLPLEWMTAQAFGRVWRSALVSVSRRQRDFREAESFLASVLHLASGSFSAAGSRSLTAYQRLSVSNQKVAERTSLEESPSEPQNPAEIRMAFTNTVSFLCAFLCAMHIVLMEISTLGGTGVENPTYPIQEVVSQLAQEACLQDLGADKDVIVNQLLICGTNMILTCYELHRSPNGDVAALDEKISYLVSVSKAYDVLEGREFLGGRVLSQLVRSIAHSYGRAQEPESTGFGLLKIIVNGMLNYNGCTNEPMGDPRVAFMRKLALDSVMIFTEASGIEEYEKIVLAAEESVRKLGGVRKNFSKIKRNKATSVSSFGTLQWDEGLCEWVAKTPATTSQTRSFVVGGPSSFNCDSPSINQRFSSSGSYVEGSSSEIEFSKSRPESSIYQESLSLGNREAPIHPNSVLKNEDLSFEDSGVLNSDQESHRPKLQIGGEMLATGVLECQNAIDSERISPDEDGLPGTNQNMLQPSGWEPVSRRSDHDMLQRKPQKRLRQTELDDVDLSSDELG